MKVLIFLLVHVIFAIHLLGQQDSTSNSSFNLLDELSTDTVAVELLPQKMLPTQRLLWGPRGLMRNLDVFELSPESRVLEMKIRRKLFMAHQILGFTTLAGMVTQGIVGSQLYKGKESVRTLHEGLAIGVNITYSLAAVEALFSPPKMLNDYKGYSSIKVHKYLAILHMTGMIATNVLAGMIEKHPELKPYHRAAAFTTLGSFALAVTIIKF